MAATVIDALRRFLPVHLRGHHHAMNGAQRRAVWAITHCRTAEMGGHLHACASCNTREFRFHSCNHRSCPQCGKDATANWVERELRKRVGAPYFMATFTLPGELRGLFFSPQAKPIHQLFFEAASSALKDTLANPRWLGARQSGFTMVLHTWNQRLHFHPHIHCIVPGAGIAADGRVVTVNVAASRCASYCGSFPHGNQAARRQPWNNPAHEPHMPTRPTNDGFSRTRGRGMGHLCPVRGEDCRLPHVDASGAHPTPGSPLTWMAATPPHLCGDSAHGSSPALPPDSPQTQNA